MKVFPNIIFLAICTFAVLLGNAQKTLIVDAKGSAEFTTIQGAISAAAQGDVILIKNGVYSEKLYIEKPGITLRGENRDNTIIQSSIARDAWRCMFKDDWGVATINIAANDINLQNLTVTNTYGFENHADTLITCHTDTGIVQKKIGSLGHQMALRTINSTRLAAINCHFRSRGGDTVSPWEVYEGQWFFKDCIMEGGVDFYCPRGWAWAENCTFIAHGGTAAIWHDGSANPDAKTVLKDCTFKGYDGFLLGRYHKDASFYLINCAFANNMRDSAIYRVPTNNNVRWGHRVFYFNCKRDAGNYAWFRNNISSAEVAAITPEWLFGNSWKINFN